MPRSPAVVVPAVLRSRVVGSAGTAGRVWCDLLPGLVADLASEWDLATTAEAPWAGFGGLAVPVTRADHSAAVLKVSFSLSARDEENEVLAVWSGRHAAQLLERDDSRHARLLERLGNESLFDLADPVQAMSVAGQLAADLAVEPPPGLQRMADVAAGLAEQIGRSSRSPDGRRGLSARSVEMAAVTFRELGSDQPGTLLHGDLQGRNVLRSARDGWAAIDPLGMVGETAIEALTLLRDRWVSLPTSASPRAALLRQLHAFAESAGSSRSRVIAWTHARAVRAVLAGVDDDGGMHAWVVSQLDQVV